MRRAVMTAAIAALVTAGAMGPPSSFAGARLADSQASTGSGSNQQEMRQKQCRYQWLDPGTWTAREERRTALCVLDRWSVSGGWYTFRRVIGCESGWNRTAYNPTGPYVGLGQHVLSSWASRVRSYGPPLWDLSTGWRNSRTMLTVTARMAHSVGWGPWTCA